MKPHGWTKRSRHRKQLSLRLRKEFQGIIQSIRHDGNEMNITIHNDVKNFDELQKRLKHLEVKMYCIRTNEKILATEMDVK